MLMMTFVARLGLDVEWKEKGLPAPSIMDYGKILVDIPQASVSLARAHTSEEMEVHAFVRLRVRPRG